ncbi:MAG TPA: hypothetical protein VGO58_18830 [Chitinophagaceae bacterium]|jgi:hypothetical protein|nr:hypothetical protein [Chitinophagaceae bacterium]
MKKIVFIALSFAMAAGLFAFTVSGNTRKTDDNQFFWYYVTYDGEQAQIEPQDPFSHITMQQAINQSYSCGGTDRICKAGYLVELTFPGNGTLPVTDDTDGNLGANFSEADPNP